MLNRTVHTNGPVVTNALACVCAQACVHARACASLRGGARGLTDRALLRSLPAALNL